MKGGVEAFPKIFKMGDRGGGRGGGQNKMIFWKFNLKKWKFRNLTLKQGVVVY